MYSARDVAEIVGLAESRVRYWAQTGFVGPSERSGGRAVYTFQDLVSVRAAKELLDRGMSLQKARKHLEALRAQLPGVDRPLARLRVLADGERLVVIDDRGTFEPLSGQLVMSFALGELEGQVAALRAHAPAPVAADAAAPAAAEPARAQPRSARDRAATAYAWFVEGGARESEGDDDGALIAYQKALDGDPALAAAHTNLGNLLYRRGERGEARARYQAALALDPEQPEARYNLANLLDELGEHARAEAEWYRVVTACPEFADAHFNLALALLRGGASGRARQHLERYLELDGDGEWATRARTLLGELG